MKRTLRKALALLLCLGLCLSLVPAGFAETESDTAGTPGDGAEISVRDEAKDSAQPGDPVSAGARAEISDAGLFPVRFYTEKGYALEGLVVLDETGREQEPVSDGDGRRYLLAPGDYTYRYHDDRDIFRDLEETGFSVGGELEIPLTLTAVFADNYCVFTSVNPLSADVADEAELIASAPSREEMVELLVEDLLAEYDGNAAAAGSMLRGDGAVIGSQEAAADALRDAMVNRASSVTFDYYSSTTFDQTAFDSILKEAFQHTGNHWEGDTLKKGYDTIKGSTSFRNEGGVYRSKVSLTITYYYNAAQEQAVRDEVNRLVSSLGLSGMSDYDKILTIHSYLYQNVNYDYGHMNDTSYFLQYTPYAALIQKISVCQGIAISFYRLCLAAGVDARYISSAVMGHGWNIVRLDGVYYELDATWDSNLREGGADASSLPHYFLRGRTWWLNNHHYPNNTYSTIGDQFDWQSDDYCPEFSGYILSDTDYAAPAFYTVRYDPNGGYNAPASQTKIHDEALTLSAAIPARTDAYAGAYTVTLDANGGSVSQSALTAARITSYGFKNWNTAADGRGTSYYPGARYTANADATLYAQWYSGTATAAVTLPVPTRDWYDFMGWAADSGASSGVTGSYTPGGNVTLHATWRFNGEWIAPDLVLPAALTEIGEEAFAGGAFSYVKLAENTVSVGSRAFADCPKLEYIYIPAGTSVAEDAFEGVTGLTVIGKAGSGTETYAEARGFTFIAVS